MSVASLLWRVKNPLKAASEVLKPCDMPLSHSFTEKLGLSRDETRNKTPSLTSIVVSICQRQTRRQQWWSCRQWCNCWICKSFLQWSSGIDSTSTSHHLWLITHAKRTSSLFETLSNWGKETDLAGKEAVTGHGTDHLNSTLLDSMYRTIC